MDNLQPVLDVSPQDLPEGFSMSSPLAGGGGGGGGGNDAAAQRRQQMEMQKEAILEQALTPDALARLRRIKLVKEKKAIEVENAIASMAMSGKLPGRINEGKLIEMLERKSAAAAASSNGSASGVGVGNGSINIQRKKYAFDSDDEDDNDDDLM